MPCGPTGTHIRTRMVSAKSEPRGRTLSESRGSGRLARYGVRERGFCEAVEAGRGSGMRRGEWGASRSARGRAPLEARGRLGDMGMEGREPGTS